MGSREKYDTAYDAGVTARRLGEKRSYNPHISDTVEAIAWTAGWEAEDAKEKQHA